MSQLKTKILQVLAQKPMTLNEIQDKFPSQKRLMRCLLELELDGRIKQVPPAQDARAAMATFRFVK